MSTDGRWNGTSKHLSSKHAGRHSGQYAGCHAATRRKPAHRAGKAVPAAAAAATLAAGAAACLLAGGSQPDPARLTVALSAPIALNAFTHAGVGEADAAASALLPQHMPDAIVGRPRAQRAPVGQPSASSATAHPAPAPSATSTPTATAATVSCSASGYLLPANVTAIVSFLLANGYSDNAVAGIAGNIYQESKGDPESIGTSGGGLVGWTPLPSGFVTGDPSADLRTQLAAILTYNNGWSAYLPELNSAATSADAAYVYVTYFERAGIPATSTREASAEAVASACDLYRPRQRTTGHGGVRR